MAWTKDEEATVKTMWADGHSCGEIARVLPDKTRNAVIGKITRKGWVRGAGNMNPKPGPKPKAAKCQAPAIKATGHVDHGTATKTARKRAVAKGLAAPIVNPAAPKRELVPADHKGRMVGLLELEKGECKFPTGYKGEHLFCGDAAHGHTYCQHHRDFLDGALTAQKKREAAAREAEQTRLRNGTSSRQRFNHLRKAA